MNAKRFIVTRGLAVMVMLCVTTSGLLAAPRTPTDSNQPYIAYLFPAGGQRGTTMQVTVGGAHLQDATAVRVSGEGITAKAVEPAAPAPSDAKGSPSAGVKPKQAKTSTAAPTSGATSLTLMIAIAPDAELGEREVRVMTPNGVSNGFRFIVGQLPEVVEKEPNDDPGTAQRLETLPVLVNGQVLESDRDYFRFTARKGQTIVCAVQARVLLPYIADAVPGWNDVVLTLFDAAGRKLQCVDDTQLRPDPVLIFQPPTDGEYVLEVRDVLYRGRADFVYRLSIGATPYVTHIFPLGGRRGSTVPVTVYGVNLPRPTIDVATADDAEMTRDVWVEAAGMRSNVLPFALGREREVTEREPNDTPAKANRIEWPCTVNGRIERPGDADCFTIKGEAGQKVAIEVLARRLGSPIDAIVTVYNAKGAKAAENDDALDPTDGLLTHHADPRLLYTFPATGGYTLRVRDVQGKGGLDYGYRLTIAPPRPDFGLRVSPDNPRVARGDSVAITVTAVRRDGYAGPIDLAVKDLPGGFLASETSIPAGQDVATLTMTAPADAPVGSFVPTVVGAAKIAEQSIMHRASGAQTLLQAFTLTQIVPSREFVLAVVDAPPSPFALALVSPPDGVVDVRQGGTAEIKVRVMRHDGVKGAVTLRALNFPSGLTIRQAQVPPEQDEGVLVVTATKQAPVNARLSVAVSGTHRGGRETTSRTLPTIIVRVRPAE